MATDKAVKKQQIYQENTQPDYCIKIITQPSENYTSLNLALKSGKVATIVLDNAKSNLTSYIWHKRLTH